jgi:hypothetical protein
MKTAIPVLAFWLVVGSSRADLVVHGVEVPRPVAGKEAHGEAPRTVFIHPRGVRIDEEGRTHVVDVTKEVLLEIDHRQKTVRRVTFKDLGAMTARARTEADAVVAQAGQQLQALPPQVRAQVEDAMRAQRSAMEARKPGAYQRTPTGKKRTVNGFACEEVKETLNGEWVGTACVHKGITLAEADKRMLVKLAEGMAQAGLSGKDDPFARAFMDGIPVEMSVRHPVTGEMKVEERVTRVEQRPVPEQLFDIPADYRVLEGSHGPRPPDPPHHR